MNFHSEKAPVSTVVYPSMMSFDVIFSTSPFCAKELFITIALFLQQLECDVCHKSFADDCELYDHVRFAHVTENVVCGECGKDFRSEKGLASHQLSAHNSDPTVQNRHKCTVCGKCYRDKQGLKEHLVTHMSVSFCSYLHLTILIYKFCYFIDIFINCTIYSYTFISPTGKALPM